MTSLSKRLEQVEKAAAAVGAVEVAQEDDIHERRRQAAWAVMRETMSDEHAQIVVEAYAAGLHEIKSAGYRTPPARLLRRCMDAVYQIGYRSWPYSDIPPQVALAMPPEVADVYLKHDVLPLHDCEDCGYKVSFGHFEACPLCVGRIGWYAYWRRKTAEQAKGGT